MDIRIPHSLLSEYLDTKASPEVIAKYLSLCGPTVDLLEKTPTDWLYHLEIITNRVDSASAFGVAREAVTILQEADIPAKLTHDPYALNMASLGPCPTSDPVSVKIPNPDLVPRFTCIALKNVVIKPSPKKTQDWLIAAGERPLNNAIDITNELTLRFGQPVHVFDLDKIKQHTMLVRESRPGEKIITLDNRTHTLPGGDMVIEDGEGRLIDLCGIMGGGLSAVSDQTTNVLLFVQTYDPQHIRKTSLITQERTLAAQLFEKQPDPEMVLPVLIEGIKLFQERAGAVVTSRLLDRYPAPPKTRSLTLNLDWLAHFIGISIPPAHITAILKNLGFATTGSSTNTLEISIPSWRLHDIAIKEDVAEEVARIYGYYRLPSVIPQTGLPQKPPDPLLRWEQIAKRSLVAAGLTEIYNNSLTATKTPFKLSNPLSSDEMYMRTTLIPSLMQNLEHNRGLVKPPIRLFELANIYLPQPKSPLALERSTVAIITQGDDLAHTKGYVTALAQALHLSFSYTPGQSARTAIITVAGEVVGQLEVLKQEIITVEINFARLSTFASPIHRFTPVPQFPAIIEDLTFALPPKTLIGPVIETIKAVDQLIESVTLAAVYQDHFTFTLTYRDPQTTLTDTQAAAIRAKIVNELTARHHATLVGKLTT